MVGKETSTICGALGPRQFDDPIPHQPRKPELKVAELLEEQQALVARRRITGQLLSARAASHFSSSPAAIA